MTDPQASWTAATHGIAYYAYSTNYLIDIAHNIIIDVEPTPALLSAEAASTCKMLERVEENYALKPNRLLGDTAYGTAPMLEWLVTEKQIAPHIPVWDRSDRGRDDCLFKRYDFEWDAENDQYLCPAGKTLQRFRRNYKKPRTGITHANRIIYRAAKHDCDTCEYKRLCCPNTNTRKITRSVYEASRDVARTIAKTPEYQQSLRDRKKVEVLFAHLKRIMKLDRLRLRGLSGAADEFVMAATVQNLKKLAQLRYKPPDRRADVPA